MSEPTFICTRCHGEAPMSGLSELPPFFFAAAGSIDACRFDAAVSENVRKPHNVLELGVVRPGEQVAQISAFADSIIMKDNCLGKNSSLRFAL